MQIEVSLVILIFGVWLGALSLALYRIYALFNKLSHGLEVTDLKKVLEKLIDKEESNKKDIDLLLKRINLLEEDGRLHIQKVGLARFNPFKELGGDHSFSLTLLDGQDSGIIITSLHTRDRTRVYMKEVKKGKSSFELSAEEKKALLEATKK